MLHWKDICTCRGRPRWIGRSINLVVTAVAATFIAASAAAQCGPGGGDCCDANGSAGCEDVACCEEVCNQDSFCCDVEWDGICGGIAVENCDICLGKPIPVDCPGDLTGNEVVGAMDLLALSDAWGPCADVEDCPADLNGDGFVNTFDILILLDAWGPCEDDVTPDGCGKPGTGDCCGATGTPFCEDEACCTAVCAGDPFCCDVEWDVICATGGFDPDCLLGPGQCGALNTPECNCGGPPTVPGEGDCCVANGTPGCDDAACEADVCAQDDFCCDVEWDDLCAGIAEESCDFCEGGGAPPPSNCCVVTGRIGCEDSECEALICPEDPFCCDTQWDQICADAAIEHCEICETVGPGPGDDCCVNSSTPGCEDAKCEELICSQDPFCCETAWDSICATTANAQCPICGGFPPPPPPPPPRNCGDPGSGDCCEPTGTPFCEDEACCEAVCAGDAFCCNSQWDADCADAAQELCGVCDDDDNGNGNGNGPGPGPDSNCCIDHGGLGCDDAACEAAVCGADPFCCETAWDGLCAGAANDICEVCDGGPGNGGEGCGEPGSGDCCNPNGTGSIGCEDEACCEAVCAGDPFCCDVEWDAFCAGEGFDPDCTLGPGNCGALNTPECDCGDPGPGPDSNCCTDHGDPGCEDEACEAEICAQDPFCCEVEWDWICADTALDACEVCN